MNQAYIDSILSTAQQEAQRQGVLITVTIVDNGGHVRAVVRQHGCSYFALESSRAKAITASQLRLPSHVVGNLGQQFPALRASFAANSSISGLPGGFPLLWNEEVVGGIGIAGGNFEQDQAIAAFSAGAPAPRCELPSEG
ncbi:GlcG/HbpS family heme-binding protein [Hymenobacter terricola]|uniref:GlcG/HbpS family heme-binding protein n=1 Tax=Hymenobacter terricola TaxID=2819236 RepID=UPI001B317DB5|nr:heme-binding protein [Hymenobacter terricola]